MDFEALVPLFTDEWKRKYQAVLAKEHLNAIPENIQKFKNGTLDWDLPFFNEEIKADREKSFSRFIPVLESAKSYQTKAKILEEIPFEHWLNVLGQRLTPASLRDENAIPPLQQVLIEACEKLFNSEITIAQRAWEKHVGRSDDHFWGDVKGNNQQKQRVVMEKIRYILNNKTWWNVFFHYKHGLVFEIRERDGHGIRWSHKGTRLIGFLEVFINE
ncbi:hypothetical protein [uncultured Chryseobacterium sp.]|uniref:hypothetical protein n=1 Tax=uncultured Chryseobacterium sp. TaxID=259322 RepID=UPI0025FE9075|nr:hypothetical protein [uncultured Chryseobacterium sp.]